VQDRSGEIIGAGSAQSAQINAQMLAQFGQDMGGVMTTFADAYKQKEQDKSDAKIYGQLLKFIAPAFGQQGDAVLAEYNSLERDRDKANYGRTVSQLLGPASNALMARGRLGVQQSGQQIQQAMPGLRNQATNAAMVTGQGGPSIMGATRRIGQTGP
jgi:hypothetical protein